MAGLAQNYAEFQDSAPELVIGIPAATRLAKVEGGLESSPAGADVPTSGGAKGKKRILGLAPWAAIAFALIFALLLVGVIVGSVLGTRDKKPITPTRTPSPSPSSTSSTTAAVTPTLAIIEAVYAAVNVTARASSVMDQGPYIILNMSDTSPWAGPDPWVNNKKCLALLHSYGSSIRTFVACDSEGLFTLVPGNVSLSPQTQEITRQGPSSADFALVSVVWGSEEIRDEGVYENIYKYKTNGSAVPFGNSFFGRDTLPGWGKSGVIWYTEDNFLTFDSILAREGDSVPF